MTEETYKYWAFISYSHQDRAWGDWLHRAIETYQVPSRLVGKPSMRGSIPKRLFPVFRDRDELPSSANLGDAINLSLRQSRYQIVICSPRSAVSRWVNEEVRYFKSIGRSDRVLCLIVDGEPNASDKPGIELQECFCPALRHDVDREGVLSERRVEAIAADARPEGDGRADAKLKLVAGLLGINYDDLKQRERQRQKWRVVQWLTAGLVLCGAVGTAWWGQQQYQAEQDRLRTVSHWVDQGRQELKNDQFARAAVYFTEALKGGIDNPSLRLMLAQALRPVEAQTGLVVQHGGAIRKVSFSADGNRFLTFGGGVGKVWESKTGKLLQTLENGPKKIFLAEFTAGDRVWALGLQEGKGDFSSFRTTVWDAASSRPLADVAGGQFPGAGSAFDPAGARFATTLIRELGNGQVNRKIQIWDVAGGGLLLTLDSDSRVNNPRFSPDGQRIVTAGEDGGPVKVWDAATGRALVSLRQRPPIANTSAYFTLDGQQIVTAAESGALRRWDAETGELIDAIGNHTGFAPANSVSADGRRWLHLGADGFKVWDIENNQQLLDGADPSGFGFDSRLSADGRWLAAAGSSKGTLLLNLDHGSVAATLDADREATDSVAIDPKGRWALTGSRSGNARLWSLPALAASPLATVRHGANLDLNLLPFVWSAEFDGAAAQFVTAGQDGAARLWDARSGEAIRAFEGHTLGVESAVFSRDGQRLLTVSRDKTARLWQVGDGKLLHRFEGHTDGLTLGRLSDDGSRAATLSADGTAGLWDTVSGQRLASIPVATGLRVPLLLTADGQGLLTTDAKGGIQLWDARTGVAVRNFVGHRERVTALALHPDGRQLLSASEDNSLRVWDLASGRERHRLDGRALDLGTDFFIHARYSHQGDWIAAAANGGGVLLWNPISNLQKRLGREDDASSSMAFSPDDRFLAMGDRKGKTQVWDIETATPLFNLPGGKDEIKSLTFSADGERLLAADFRGSTALLWDTRRETRSASQLAQLLRCRVPWRVHEGKLVAAATEPAACRGVAGLG